MPRQLEDLRALLTRAGVVARRERPDLARSMDRLLRTGEVVAVLPGVHAAAGRAHE